ncbi:unnamed protein product [Durusdinium trenchii]|uniref:Uncharacterized protein n=1 Tax=Durusdinium trenchii TaxID=1381693 RepID=A0ABP0L017_9DINO
MSRDSTVSALPSQGWSCETLERGIVEAARVSGVNLNPESLSEVTKSVMMAMQANGATKQNVAVVKTEPVSPRKQALTPPSAIKAGFNSPTLFQQMCSQQTIPGDIGDLAIPPVPAPSSATHGEGTPAVPTPPVHATGLPLGLPNVSLPAERSHGGSGAASPAGSAQSQAIDQAIRAEKQKNEELQKQILALQAQMRQQAEVKNPEPKHVAFEAPPAPSRVEILLEQAMARITSMEESMKQSESKPVESLPKSNASTLEPALPAKQNKPEPAEPAEPTEQEMFGSDAASDTDSEEATITTPSGHTVRMSADALRMRCRRLCERKPSGKYNIDAKVSEQYREGGSSREVLEMALLECIAKHGVIRSAYKKIKAEFVTKCKLIRERLESRETEKRGKWYTEDQLKKSNQFSAVAVRKIISYCKKFPESLVRPWQYNDQISEYYVIVDDQTLLKKAETTIEREETQLDDKTSKDAPAGLPKDLVNIPDPTPSLEVVGAQPVADLEAYMGSLEKKQQSVEKMVDTLGGSSDENAKKLHGPLQSLDEKMKASFGTLGSQLTELKMDHRDGKLESDRLSALLKEIAEEKQTVKTLCTSLIPLDSRYRQLVKDLNLEKGNKKNKKGKGKGKANKKEKTAETASGPKKTPKSKTSKASKGKPSKKAKVPRKGKKTLEHQSEPSQKGPKRAKKTT